MPAMHEAIFVLSPGTGFLLFLAGTAAGFVNVLAGGGSLLTLPLMIFLGLPGSLANGTNRVAILAQNVSGSITFRRLGVHDFRQSVILALIALPGAALGATLGSSFSGPGFDRLLAAVMLGVLVATSAKTGRDDNDVAPPATPGGRRRGLTYVGIFAVGFYGGFIQAGVGFLLIALLHRGMQMRLTTVNMHKLFVVGVYTLVALIIFACRGQVCWVAGICLALGNSLGAWIGAHTAVKQGDPFIRIVFNVAVIAMAIALLARSF